MEGALGRKVFPVSYKELLDAGPACFGKGRWRTREVWEGMTGIPQSSRNVVTGPTNPCEDSIQGCSTLVAGLQRECFIKVLFTLYFLCFSSDTAHGSQRIISWTLAW